jgi:hypothetical protein
MNNNSEQANILYTTLIESGVRNTQGRVQLELMGVSIDIADKSATGNLLQEWLGGWMSQNGIQFRVQDNTQAFPDFFLGQNDTHALLEMKSFDYTNSPNFDVANFDTYRRSIATHAYRLDADYLIFGYELETNGLIIRDVWLKKVWEICCPAEQYPLRTQVKQGVIHNIRPYNFKLMSKGYQPFANRLDFVNAIKETVHLYKPEEDVEDWFNQVKNSYRETFNQEL